MLTAVTIKGQVTIPKAMRQKFGLQAGQTVEFYEHDNCLALRPARSARSLPQSGFGLIKSDKPAVPADFDVAELLRTK